MAVFNNQFAKCLKISCKLEFMDTNTMLPEHMILFFPNPTLKSLKKKSKFEKTRPINICHPIKNQNQTYIHFK